MLVGWVPGYEDENDLVEKIWALCSRHGKQAAHALRRMRELHEGVLGVFRLNGQSKRDSGSIRQVLQGQSISGLSPLRFLP